MTKNITKKKNIDFFTKLSEKYGNDVKSLNWGSIESQELRFKILLEVGALNGESILDIGCGLGDLYKYLKEKQYVGDYHGVDITPNMVKKAKQNHPKGNFEIKDVFMEHNKLYYDYILSSGIFYLTEGDQYKLMFDMIEKMFRMAKKGLAFNTLSSWSETLTKGEFYADPIKTISFCRGLTNKVVLRHDYHPSDFTIYLKK